MTYYGLWRSMIQLSKPKPAAGSSPPCFWYVLYIISCKNYKLFIDFYLLFPKLRPEEPRFVKYLLVLDRSTCNIVDWGKYILSLLNGHFLFQPHPCIKKSFISSMIPIERCFYILIKRELIPD